MKIHYFQRYHAKENVATANTMLLLSRLYQYSTDLFYKFLRSIIENNQFEPELEFLMQQKNNNAVPDAVISQQSFKILVETKLFDWFYKEQLQRHLSGFKNEDFKILMTLAPDYMDIKKKEDFEKNLEKYNEEKGIHIYHINTTFDDIVSGIKSVLSDNDYDMKEVLDDYLDYCANDKLISRIDAWKTLRMQLAGTTYDFNVENGVYYDAIDRGFRPHDYLGLYKNKSVKAIGRINAIFTATIKNGELVITGEEQGKINEDRKSKILMAIEDGKKYGYELPDKGARYFFVDKFYETDLKKTSPNGVMGTRIFDLSELLGIDENKGKTLPSVEEIAEILKNKTWS